jgi:hypothetical protein
MKVFKEDMIRMDEDRKRLFDRLLIKAQGKINENN